MATNLRVWVVGDDIEAALREMKKRMLKTGLIKEIRKREFYQKPSQRRNTKSLAARKKLRKAQVRYLAKERNDEVQTPSRKVNAGRAR